MTREDTLRKIAQLRGQKWSATKIYNLLKDSKYPGADGKSPVKKSFVHYHVHGRNRGPRVVDHGAAVSFKADKRKKVSAPKLTIVMGTPGELAAFMREMQ